VAGASAGPCANLNVDRDADAVVDASVRIRLNKFRQSVPLPTHDHISFIIMGMQASIFGDCPKPG